MAKKSKKVVFNFNDLIEGNDDENFRSSMSFNVGGIVGDSESQFVNDDSDLLSLSNHLNDISLDDAIPLDDSNGTEANSSNDSVIIKFLSK